MITIKNESQIEKMRKAGALLHAVLGFVLLYVLNTFVQVDFLHLEMNLANCIVAGVGGVPGIILLLLYQYFMT